MTLIYAFVHILDRAPSSPSTYIDTCVNPLMRRIATEGVLTHARPQVSSFKRTLSPYPSCQGQTRRRCTNRAL